MKNNTFETLIGGLVVVIATLFLLLSLKLSNTKQNISGGYDIIAEFTNVDGINIGSDVKISGVKIGNVSDVMLNKDNYRAKLIIKMPKDIKIPTDSIFKISTSGFIGSKFINIKIGAEDTYFENNDIAEFTESTMDLEDLISRFIFNSKNNENNKND